MTLLTKALFIEEIRKGLKESEGEKVLDHPYPKPYPDHPINSKAILLGCDPSNKHCQDLPYVFAIRSSHKIFNSFVASLQKQLGAVGLSLETVYSQNLCRNYFKDETSKNSIWETVARLWIPVLKKELDEKCARTTPMLLTSEVLYKILLNEDVAIKKAKDFYSCLKDAPIPVPAKENKLGRPLIPFYRHYKYDLTIKEWETYRNIVREIVMGSTIKQSLTVPFWNMLPMSNKMAR